LIMDFSFLFSSMRESFSFLSFSTSKPWAVPGLFMTSGFYLRKLSS